MPNTIIRPVVMLLLIVRLALPVALTMDISIIY